MYVPCAAASSAGPRRDSKIGAVQGGGVGQYNLEAEVRGLSRSLAALQGTSRQVLQAERAHNVLKEELEKYKAVQQDASAKALLGTYR